MSRQEELLRRQQEQRLQERQMELLQEDRKTIGLLQEQPRSQFRFDRKKSLARNYRDFALAQALRQEEPAGAAFGRVLDHLDARRVMEEGRPLTVPGDSAAPEAEGEPLQVQTAIRSLCRCAMTVRAASQEELIELTENLTAGQYLEKREGQRDLGEYDLMHRAGLKGLQEVYYRVLEGLNAKYGEQLSSLSAEKYLKRREEIEGDMACLRDMKTFLGGHMTHQLEHQEAMLSRVDYYLGTMEVLRLRGQELAQALGERVTEKGQLTREARKDYENRLKELLKTARAGKAFRKREKGERVSLADTFRLSRKRKKEAMSLYLTYQTEVEEPAVMALENQKLTASLEDQLREYGTYRNYVKLMEDQTMPRGARANIRYAIDRYLNNPAMTLRTDEQEQAMNAQLEKIRNSGALSDGPVEVDQDNAGPVIESCIRRYEELRSFIQDSTDAVFLQGCREMTRMALGLEVQVHNIVFGKGINRIKLEVLDHEKGQRQLAPKEYQRKKALMERYDLMRELNEGPALQIDRVVNQMNTRLKTISRYGCTQNVSRTADTDPLELRRSMEQNRDFEDLKEEQQQLNVRLWQTRDLARREKKPAIRAQLEREAERLNAQWRACRRGRLQAMGVNQMEYKSFSSLEKNPELAVSRELEANLEEMVRARELQQSDPAAFQLRGGFRSWMRRQFMAGLQPLYQELLELTYQRYQLKERPEGETQGELERRWHQTEEKYDVCFRRLQEQFPQELKEEGLRISSHSANEEEEEALREKLRREYCQSSLSQGQLQQERLEKQLAQGPETEETRALLADRAWSFARSMDPEEVAAELKRLAPVARLKGSRRDPEYPAIQGGLHMVRGLTRQLADCVNVLRQGDQPFCEERFLENHDRIERCALMEESITRLMGDSGLLQYLNENSGDFPEEDRLAIRGLRERRRLIRGLYQYSAGLQLRQAGTAGVKEMDCLYAGEMVHLSSPELLRHTGNILLQRGLTVLQPLMDRRD